jgi:hypothetical protein
MKKGLKRSALVKMVLTERSAKSARISRARISRYNAAINDVPEPELAYESEMLFDESAIEVLPIETITARLPYAASSKQFGSGHVEVTFSTLNTIDMLEYFFWTKKCLYLAPFDNLGSVRVYCSTHGNNAPCTCSTLIAVFWSSKIREKKVKTIADLHATSSLLNSNADSSLSQSTLRKFKLKGGANES